MTYREKYQELLSQYTLASETLRHATDQLSQVNGFIDGNELRQYSLAHQQFEYHRKQFERLLKYLDHSNLHPDTEFHSGTYMFETIRTDQLEKGIALKEQEPLPNGNDSWNYYSCSIGLTNEQKEEVEHNHTFYLFPVISLEHGKECYAFLSDKLQFNPEDGVDIEQLDFNQVIDVHRPIFVKVSLGVW